jgi:hypothetical protein
LGESQIPLAPFYTPSFFFIGPFLIYFGLVDFLGVFFSCPSFSLPSFMKLCGVFYLNNNDQYEKGSSIIRKTMQLEKTQGYEISINVFENKNKDTRLKRIKFSINFTLHEKEKQERTITGFRIVYLPCDTETLSLKNSFGPISKPYPDIQRLLLFSNQVLTKQITTKDDKQQHDFDTKFHTGDKIAIIFFCTNYVDEFTLVYDLDILLDD